MTADGAIKGLRESGVTRMSNGAWRLNSLNGLNTSEYIGAMATSQIQFKLEIQIYVYGL